MYKYYLSKNIEIAALFMVKTILLILPMRFRKSNQTLCKIENFELWMIIS